MTKEQYDKRMEEIRRQQENQVQHLNESYALENNPYQIGDIIYDHIITIKIEQITVAFEFCADYPCCIYHGLRMKKSGKPFKSGEMTYIYQENVKGKVNK